MDDPSSSYFDAGRKKDRVWELCDPKSAKTIKQVKETEELSCPLSPQKSGKCWKIRRWKR